MSCRDLLQNPCWTVHDLGQPLPDSPHAVSVSLPRWKDVIAYEEKEESCIQSLKSIYPRFGLNPLVSQLAKHALDINGLINFNAWPYPNTAAAEKALHHCQRVNQNGKVFISEVLGLKCLITDQENSPSAKAFWQHTGLGASSRQAAIALNKENAPLASDGESARATIKNRLSKIYDCDQNLIELHPSGMAALTSALEIIFQVRPRRPTMQLGFPYVDVLKLPQEIFEGGELILKTNQKCLEEELDKRNPAAVIVELPSNPLLQCVDLPTVARLAHQRGIPVIADDTIGSAINIDVLPYADLVFSSLTKSFAGRGDILAGALLVSPISKWKEIFLQKISKAAIAPLASADAIALEEGSRDVIERLPKLNKACTALKNRLQEHPAIARVLHPAQCKNFKALMRPGAGHGCLLSFELAGGLKQAKKFYDALQVNKGPSLGTNFTLACPYVLLAHYKELSWAEECGVPAHLMRVSVGLEDSETLWNRFETALKVSG